MIAAALLIVLAVACTPTAPDTTEFAESARVADDVVDANLMPWVEQLASARAGDTKVSCEGYPPANLFPSCSLTRDAAVILVSEAFVSMGYTPSTVVLGVGPHATYNVVTELPGTSRQSEVVLVACHLDAYFAGADDNGSGVAAMLETARAVCVSTASPGQCAL